MKMCLPLLLPGAGGWSPLSSDPHQWLEVDLGGRTRITAVATQGRYGSSDWLTSYQLMFSDAGHNWKQYRQEDSRGALPGNTNADSVVLHKLQHPVIARHLRLLPLDWNPRGRIGLRLETYGCSYGSHVVSLGGRGGLLFRLSPGPRRTSGASVSLTFKTLRNSGVLLRAEGRSEHGLVLQLEEGKLLLLLLRKGRTASPDGRRLVSLGSLLDDQHWHHVSMELGVDGLNLTVDGSSLWVRLPPRLAHWDHQQVSVGAGRGPRRAVGGSGHFHGCLENLVYNGVNLLELAEKKDQRVTGDVIFSCAESVPVAMTFTSAQSFLRLPLATEAPPSTRTSAGLQFRTWNEAGLLLTFDLPEQEGAAWLYLSGARLHLRIHKAGRAPLELSAGSALNDGQWHSAELTSRRGHLSVSVDGGEGATVRPLRAGCPADGGRQDCVNPFKAFQGCMRLLTVHNQPVDPIPLQQRLMGNYSHLQIDMCGILDRCSQSHCEHGGSCRQSWSSFHCNCSGTGYSGATCHSSIYEQSCEAYKHRGNASGYYHIDVDGSGPIRARLMYCNMTEDHTWTVIQHNNTALTRVRPAPGGGRISAHFAYASDEEQLAAVIGQSERCEQELSYDCRKSRLLNTADGPLLSWWVGGPGDGQVQTYWGGAPPGSQRCSCGLQQNCVDPRHACNCDADRSEWYRDSGLLTHKETLPVRSLVLGDVQRSDSEGAYRVGPLRCHGDKNVWNAALFDQETSYLHFPTFHGELSADISFLFKTSSSSGVFLENLGIKDFIRIELRSSTEVLFSFDVGDGPTEVAVTTGFPLDDDRWHRVRAERNVRAASLRLDELPAATREAPADGHVHLQLNSQLFIEVSASFKSETSVSYAFNELDRGSDGSPSPAVSSDLDLRAEDLSLSFRSLQSPALLLFVGSSRREYLALLLNQHDMLEVRYRLDSSRAADVLRSKVTNLADGRLHAVVVSRRAAAAWVQVTYKNTFRCSQQPQRGDSAELDPGLSRLASLGFTGCLSGVLFNSVSPLKAALLHPDTSPVVVTGPLVQSICASLCGCYVREHCNRAVGITTRGQSGSVGTGQPVENAVRRDSALIGGGIAVAIFVTVSALAVTARVLYRGKGTCRRPAGKTAKPDDGDGGAGSRGGPSENQREYFI
uniref:Contactin associated protein like 3 n=1 Tax=Gasterosteus aculeatus aculeatus TaxID=481459 RepID=A0AAQ4SAE7_GASAC